MKLFTTVQAVAIVAALILTYQTLQAQSFEELMAKADASDRAFQAGEALRNYQLAEKLEPENVQILISIARQYRHLMTDAGTVREKLKLGSSALAYGEKAALTGPNDSEAQLSTAITYGKMLPYLGKKEQVAASPRIKAAADKAIKLDSRNDTAWHVLGRWHQSLANVSGVRRAVGEVLYGTLPHGTNAESIACFEKAIAINPGRLRHYIEKGRSHAAMDQNEIAKKLIQKGMAMPNKEKDDPEVKIRGREALAKLP